MFNILSKLFSVKQLDIEAKLLPTADCTFGGIGEVELEAWSDGTMNLEATLKHSGLPDSTEIDVCFGGRQVLSMQINSGFAREYVRTKDIHVIPAINSGDMAEMRYQGKILYRGQFRPD